LTALLLLWVGYLLSTWFIPRCSLLERAAWVVLLGISATALLVANLGYGLSLFIDQNLVVLAAGGLLLALAPHGLKRQSSKSAMGSPQRLEAPASSWLFGLLTLGVGLLYWLYYSDAEFLYSLIAYLLRGEAECFYMQTFSFISDLNPTLSAPEVDKAHNIISTPGNTLFTTMAMGVFGRYGFQVLYLVFAMNLSVFTALLVLRWTESRPAALLAALFVCLNPYVLSVEVLDRNFITLSLSASAFYALAAHRDRIFLHGLLFGLCASTGLRFLPLLFLASVALVYTLRKVRFLSLLLFLFAFALAFAVNIPHLSYHGFHSLGETESLPSLLWLVVTEFQRSPFVPLPNLLLYPLHILAYLGSLLGALIALGAMRCWQQDRRVFFTMAPAVLLPWLVLACQRDWLQADKSRILVMSMLPLAVFLAFALRSCLAKRQLFSDLCTVLVGVLLIQGLAYMGTQLNRPVDAGSYQRHSLYQHDNDTWQSFYQSRFATIGSLPSASRLFQKADLGRKARADQALLANQFGTAGDELLRSNPWVQRELAGDAMARPAPAPATSDWVSVEIDLEALVSDPGAAVSWDHDNERAFVDLSTESNRIVRIADFGVQLAARHKEVEVSWQPQPLPVTALTGQSEPTDLGEVYIDLNAWISLGRDDLEFQQINMISYANAPQHREQGLRSSMKALPPRNKAAKISLRVPRGMQIIVRNWLVDGRKGTPHRIDSWSVDTLGLEPKLRFHPMEPESYL